jgi:hypothetical protein
MSPLHVLGNVMPPPGLAAPYLPVLFAPYLWLGGVAIEAAMIYAFNRQLGFARVAGVTVAANVVSWVVGLITAVALSDLVFFPPPWPRPYVLAFAVLLAFVLSIGVEYGFLMLVFRRTRLNRRFFSIFLANTASFLFLLAIPWRL